MAKHIYRSKFGRINSIMRGMSDRELLAVENLLDKKVMPYEIALKCSLSLRQVNAVKYLYDYAYQHKEPAP